MISSAKLTGGGCRTEVTRKNQTLIGGLAFGAADKIFKEALIRSWVPELLFFSFSVGALICYIRPLKFRKDG